MISMDMLVGMAFTGPAVHVPDVSVGFLTQRRLPQAILICRTARRKGSNNYGRLYGFG